MDVSLDLAALGSIYITWTGFGLRAYKAYPNSSAYLYLFCAISFTAIVVWAIYDIDKSIRKSEDQNRLIEVCHSIHICFNPRDVCNRCGGFFWGIFIGILISSGFSSMLIDILESLPFPPLIILVVSFGVFLFSVGIHGLLNGIQKVYDVDDYLPAWVFASATKIVLGFTAGLATLLMAASWFLVADSSLT